MHPPQYSTSLPSAATKSLYRHHENLPLLPLLPLLSLVRDEVHASFVGDLVIRALTVEQLTCLGVRTAYDSISFRTIGLSLFLKAEPPFDASFLLVKSLPSITVLVLPGLAP